MARMGCGVATNHPFHIAAEALLAHDAGNRIEEPLVQKRPGIVTLRLEVGGNGKGNHAQETAVENERLFKETGFRESVQRENIDPDSHLALVAFHLDRSAVVVGLGKRIEITVAGIIDESEPFLVARRILVFQDGDEFFVILAQHANVNIVVPRDIALVTHRPQKRAVGKAILQVVFLANAIDLVQNGHLNFTTFLLFNLLHFLFPAETAFLSLSIFFLTTRP